MWLPAFILDPLIRRKMRLAETPLDRFRVRIARTTAEYQDAFRLLHVAYVFQGIESIGDHEMRITPQHVLPESTVFVAYEGKKIVGTMTVTLDSPSGLPLDKDYPEHLAALRQKGARLVEFGSLAVVQRCWHSGVTNLLNIAAHQWSRNVCHATHCVVGTHPRAHPVYRAAYAFRRLGRARLHAELNAPVLGMVYNLKKTERHIARHYKKLMGSGLRPIEHFRGAALACIEIPTHMASHELARWKMPRDVFQELFFKRSSRMSSLDPATRRYLTELRSRQTLELDRSTGSEARAIASTMAAVGPVFADSPGLRLLPIVG